jgi:RHS repeat-associated protein
LATLTESGQTTTYTWDARDRLVALSGPGLSASFTYDADRRRTSKTTSGFSTTFLYDGVDVIKEVAGGATVSYLRGLGIDEHLARIDDSAGTSCYVPDALGSTVALTDGGGAVPTEYTYELFGRTVASGAASANAFQFTGRENDGTGLYYYRARYLAPWSPRFAQEDPAERAGAAPNLYEYAGNGPVNFVVPLGLQATAPPVAIPRPGPVGPPFPIPLPPLWIPSPAQWEEMKEDLAWAFDPRPLIQTIASGIEACLLFFADGTIPRPAKPKRGCTCTCRADADDTMPGNIKPGLPRFALGTATAANCAQASVAAKREATKNLGMKPKHIPCVCVGGD